MLLKLSAPGLDHPGKGHVIELLDYFEHDGPNGTHLCLVLPAMISDGEITSVVYIGPKAGTRLMSLPSSMESTTYLGLGLFGSFGLTAEQIDKEHTYRISQLLDENGQMHENFRKHLTDRLPYDFGSNSNPVINSRTALATCLPWQCGTIRGKPRKRDYFLEQPSACSLGKVLASEAGVTHIDKLGAWRNAQGREICANDGGLKGIMRKVEFKEALFNEA
ncbi:predicted protein [Histoplasma mississippiense (nom. inval.)]|uniref:predicted protein n=1 Tax=Ajellomyces capsulatus (strain NAm1 / WU24) TaxID=2059318 RepID=UPI000157B43D|nr:predicted protein [Histoplasma mississippiense (nom. inval.)]EDN02332.1 predicted protein [Histoplasma mississippiense (nom. inval.)]